MQRIAIVGSGGAGKSTFARRLGPILGLPVYHLDALHWQPGWIETPPDEWADKLRTLVARPVWILDGNYAGTMEIRFEAADTIIFFDFSRLICIWRVVRRALFYRGESRPDMAPGCPERLEWPFLVWVWTYPSRKRPVVLALLNQYATGRRIVYLRSPGEAESVLRQLATRTSEADLSA